MNIWYSDAWLRQIILRNFSRPFQPYKFYHVNIILTLIEILILSWSFGHFLVGRDFGFNVVPLDRSWKIHEIKKKKSNWQCDKSFYMVGVHMYVVKPRVKLELSNRNLLHHNFCPKRTLSILRARFTIF